MKCSAFRVVVIFTAGAAFVTVLTGLRIFHAQAPEPAAPHVHFAVDAEDDQVETPVARKEQWLILLAFQRSGTHWLTQELSRHPCIYVAGAP